MNNITVHPKDLIIETCRKIKRKASLLFIALLIPAVILNLSSGYMLSVIQQGPENGNISEFASTLAKLNILALILHPFIYAIAAVSVHRIIILGKDSLPSRWGVYFSLRELKYIGWGFICYAPVIVVSATIVPRLAIFLTSNIEESMFFLNPRFVYENLALIMNFSTIFLAAAFLSIFGLVLPGTAIEGFYSLKKAFTESKNIRIPLFISLLSIAIVVKLVGQGLRLFVTSINILNGSIIPNFINSLVIFILGIFGIALLSVTYEIIKKEGEQEQNT